MLTFHYNLVQLVSYQISHIICDHQYVLAICLVQIKINFMISYHHFIGYQPGFLPLSLSHYQLVGIIPDISHHVIILVRTGSMPRTNKINLMISYHHIHWLSAWLSAAQSTLLSTGRYHTRSFTSCDHFSTNWQYAAYK
jgi:hypothetical protein